MPEFQRENAFFQGVDPHIEIFVGDLRPVHPGEVSHREPLHTAQHPGLHVAHLLDQAGRRFREVFLGNVLLIVSHFSAPS